MEEKNKVSTVLKTFFHSWKGKLWFLLNMLCSASYLIWRIFFTIPFGYGVISVTAGISLLIVEALGMLEAFIHFINMYSVRNYKLPEVFWEKCPDVDIFIATYNESTELLYKTVHACTCLKYPEKNKVHIYLCDDGHREEMKALAGKMGINYLDREDNEGAKAGNLNHALSHTGSPYIVTIDADMLLCSDFLLKTIPYFIDAEERNAGRKPEDRVELGFVQTPQSFYNLDLFQFNLHSENRIPNEQDYFYKDIQVARTKTNSVIYGGSNTVLSRKALEAVGGFYTKAITEDFATGILIEKKQYVSVGVGEVLASGLSPTDIKQLIQQRVRWARGVISTGRKMRIFSSPELTLSQKMNYWASVWYWYAPLKRLIYILSPILYATFGFMVFKCTLPQVLLFWLPMYLTSNISLRMLSGNIRTTKWTGVYETVLFPFMLLPVLLETIGISMKKFKVTDKGEQKNEKGRNLLYMIPFLILIFLSVVGIIRCILVMLDSGSFSPVVVLFWLVNNLYMLIMSVFFMDGRVPYRKAERVQASGPCEILDDKKVYQGEIRDMSETGAAIILNKPYYFEEGKQLLVKIETEDYHVLVDAEVVHVNQNGEKWIYSIKITDYRESYDDLLGVLYDRKPTIPDKIKKDSGTFDDLKINIKKRTVPPFYQKRKYPRVVLDLEYTCREPEGKKVRVYDFNYVYLTLSSSDELKKMVINAVDDIVFECAYESEIRKGLKLYRVENCTQLLKNKDNRDKLAGWLVEQEKLAKQNKQEENGKEQKEREFDEKDLV